MIVSGNIQTSPSAAQSSAPPKNIQRLLEPLIWICRFCLEYHHSYVRKSAVFAVYPIYREFENLIPDAPELLQTFLAAEASATCKRNEFVYLVHCAMPKVVEWILSVFEQISGMHELLQRSIIEVIRLDCKNDSAHRMSD
jgi:coatomer subunit beta